MGDSSVEKLIQKFCLAYSFIWYKKKVPEKNGTSYLVQVFGTGFWCVCHWHKSVVWELLLLIHLIIVYMQKLQDGDEIDLKLLGEALSGENEVVEVSFENNDSVVTLFIE